jgi:hypothetical protein
VKNGGSRFLHHFIIQILQEMNLKTSESMVSKIQLHSDTLTLSYVDSYVYVSVHYEVINATIGKPMFLTLLVLELMRGWDC